MSSEDSSYTLKREAFGQLINFKAKEMPLTNLNSISFKPDEKAIDNYVPKNPKSVTLSNIVEKSFLAKVANNLREQIRGVSACFVIGRTGEDTVSISARSDGTINVGLLTDKLGGGGQYDRAGAAFTNVKVGLVESKLLDCLDTYLEEARSDLGGERI